MVRYRRMNSTPWAAGFAFLMSFVGLAGAQAPAGEVKADELKNAQDPFAALMTEIRHSFQARRYDEAIRLTDEALVISPDNPLIYRFRTGIHFESGDMEGTREDLTHIMRLDGASVPLLNERAMINFRLGDFRKSVIDFDDVLRLDSQQARNAWMRGISLYYAGEYEAGRRQFEFVQRNHPDDIENALWKFMCTAKYHGLGVARVTLVTKNKDSREPMEQIHAFYKGRISESEFLAGLESLQGSPAQIKQAKFFGYMYLGLFYDAIGENDKSFDNVRQAVGPYYSEGQFLAVVADVHLKRP